MTQERYPHIEKVWETKYKKQCQKPDIRKTLYTALRDNNETYLNDRALRYFGNNIAFGKMFEWQDATVKALKEYGVKNGQYVSVCVAGIPEMVYTLYACSQIGAVANLISPFFDKEDLIARISDCESDVLIIMDKFYPALKSAIQKSRIKHVIIVPTLNSSLLRFVTKTYKREKFSNELYWNQFIKDGRNQQLGSAVEYEKNKPLAMVYSSGSTGASKGILLSNDSFYNTAIKYPGLGVDITRGQTFYQIIPPWFSTGISICINLPLMYGCTVLQDPRFDRDVFIRNVLKEKPTYTVAPTSMYEGLLDPKLYKGGDLSFWKYPFEGGEPLRKEVAEKINAVLKSSSCDSELLVGYGQCECGATITSQVHGESNTSGSVGIPLPSVNIMIVDDNYNPLPYNQRGRILVNTPSSMLEYYKNKAATEKYFYYDNDGVKWNCTGDIGYINEQGELFVSGRDSDYTIVNDRLVYNFDVEDIILDFPEVKNVDVLDTDGNGKSQLVVHIILEPSYATDLNDGKKSIGDLFDAICIAVSQKLGDEAVPHIFKVRDSFPYAKSGKRDTQAMKNEVDGFIVHKSYIRHRI